MSLSLEEEKIRGGYAKQVLDNPLFRETITIMRAELYESFAKTKFNQKDERDEIGRKQQVVEWFEGRLKRVMQGGQMAEKTLLQRAKEKIDQYL